MNLILISFVLLVNFLALYTGCRLGLLFFIASMTLLPRQIGISISDGAALSVNRILIIMFLFLVLMNLIKLKKLKFPFIENDRDYNAAFGAICIYFLVRIAATLFLNSSGIFYAIEPAITFFVLWYYFRSSKNNLSVVHSYFKATCFFVACFLLIEFFAQKNPLSVFYDESIAVTRESVAFLRDESYRFTASFSNPLVLAQFTSISLSYLLISARKSYTSFFAFCVSSLILYFLTWSRAFFLIQICIILLYFLGYLVSFKRVIRLVNKYLFVTIPIFFIIGIYLQQTTDTSYVVGQSSQNSFNSRVLQFSYALNIFSASPFFGLGVSQNIIADFDEVGGVDSMWLRIFFESGLLGLAAFLIFIISLSRLLSERSLQHGNYNLYFSFLCSFFWSFFIAIPHLFFIYFIFLFVGSHTVYRTRLFCIGNSA